MSDLAPNEPHQDVAWPVLERTELAVVRYEQVTIPQLRECYDEANVALGVAIEAGTLHPVGPFLGIYHGDPMGTFDLEVGFPVEQAPEGLRASHLPAGPYAAMTHIGPYDDLGLAWGALMGAVLGGGAAPVGLWIESYVSDPTDDVLRTDLLLPIIVTEAAPE